VADADGRVASVMLDDVPHLMRRYGERRDRVALVDVLREMDHPAPRIEVVAQDAAHFLDVYAADAVGLHQDLGDLAAGASGGRADLAHFLVGVPYLPLGVERQGQGWQEQEHRGIPEEGKEHRRETSRRRMGAPSLYH